jgi:hypothetical protein
MKPQTMTTDEKVNLILRLWDEIFIHSACDLKEYRTTEKNAVNSVSLDGAGLFHLTGMTIYNSRYGGLSKYVFDTTEDAQAAFKLITSILC